MISAQPEFGRVAGDTRMPLGSAELEVLSPEWRELLAGLRELYVGSGEQCPFRNKAELHAAMKYMVLGVVVVSLPRGVEIETPATTTASTPA